MKILLNAMSMAAMLALAANLGYAATDAAGSTKKEAKAEYSSAVDKAKSDYKQAKDTCKAKSGNDKDVCMKDAKAKYKTVKADAKAAWVTSKLEFFKQPMWMKQFPFAHTIDMTYRLAKGALEVEE